MFFPDAISLFEYWLNNPPPSESLQALLQAYTDWKPSRRSNERRVSDRNNEHEYDREYDRTPMEEKRDLGGLAQQLGTRALSASALPAYMKLTMNKEFGLSLK